MSSANLRTVAVAALAVIVITGVGITAAGASTASQGDGPTTETDVELAVATAWADPLGETDALLAANVTTLDGTDGAWVWFEYRADGDDRWQRLDGGDVEAPGLVRAQATGLKPGTTYEYRALATDWNETTVVTGETKTFATEVAVDLEVRTEWADSLGETEFLLAGNLTKLEGADTASVWFEIRPEEAETWTHVAGHPVNATGSFTVVVDDLEPATTYEYRARATDWYQSTFVAGETRTFTTLHTPANVTTDPIADDAVDESSAVLSATVWDLGSADQVDVFFLYWEAGSNGWERTMETTITEPQTVSQHVDGLSPDTTYEYEAVAAWGEYGDSVAIGERMTFTTAPPLRVATHGVTNVTDTAALVHGAIETAQWSDELSVGAEYREQGASSWERTDGRLASDGTFTTAVTDLEPGTTYEFRVVAEEGEASAVGAVVTATTDRHPVVSTGQSSAVDDSSATVVATLVDLGGATSATVAIEYREQDGEDWQSTDGVTLTEPGTVQTVLTDLDDETTYEYRAVALASDGYADVGSVRTFTTDVAERPPTVDGLHADEDSPPNPHAEFSIEWTVSDADGDLESVSVTVRTDDGESVYTSTSSVNGQTASGSEAFGVKHGAGETYAVTIEVADATGATTTEQTTVRA